MELHYGRDDFTDRDRLVRTLSRDRSKDMASDYEQRDPAQDYAERRGISFRERVAEIVRKVVPEKLRDRIDQLLDGFRSSPDGAPSREIGQGPERERERAGEEVRREAAAPEKEAVEDPEEALRKTRTRALVRHARAVDAIFAEQEIGSRASPEQTRELNDSRDAFEKVRPFGWRDAEAAYLKDTGLAREAAGGKLGRAIRALQLETEIRTDPQRVADRFVERWQKLQRASQLHYQAGEFSHYNATRSAMGDMASSLERDPQLESLLANRKRELGIDVGFDSGRRLGVELAFSHGLGRGRGLDIGM
jgi:hypothetical protein